MNQRSFPLPLSGKEMLKLFLNAGWSKISQKGSHVKMRKGRETVIIPMHKELKKGMENALLKRMNG
jgi:predicted RNA binding protein YcfA (HicA-like mRNA interferase family)